MRRQSFSTVPQFITKIKERICIFSITESARREKESAQSCHISICPSPHEPAHSARTGKMHVFVLGPRSENRSLDLFCTLPTPLTLLRALLSSIPSLFFLHCGLARHLPLYFLLIISVYPLGGPREAALESPPAHIAGVFYITLLTGTISASTRRKYFIVSVRLKPDF